MRAHAQVSSLLIIESRLRETIAAGCASAVRAPDPSFEFWVDDDGLGLGLVLPDQSQLGIELRLDLECGLIDLMPSAFDRRSAPLSANCMFLSATRTIKSSMLAVSSGCLLQTKCQDPVGRASTLSSQGVRCPAPHRLHRSNPLRSKVPRAPQACSALQGCAWR